MKHLAKKCFERGFECADKGEWLNAIDIISYGLRIEPDNYDAIANRCTCYAMAGMLAEALADADHLLIINPDDVAGHLSRGNVLATMELFQDALKAYDSAIDKFPDEPALLIGRGNVHSELQHTSLALADYDAAITLNKNLLEAHIGRARALRDLDLLDNAVEAYEQLLAIEDDESLPIVVEVKEELSDIKSQLQDGTQSGDPRADAGSNP